MAHPWTPFGDRTSELRLNLRKIVKAQIANITEHKLLIFRLVSTRERWANPLSIYGPTPTEPAVSGFNATMQDLADASRKTCVALQEQLTALRAQRRGFKSDHPATRKRHARGRRK